MDILDMPLTPWTGIYTCWLLFYFQTFSGPAKPVWPQPLSLYDPDEPPSLTADTAGRHSTSAFLKLTVNPQHHSAGFPKDLRESHLQSVSWWHSSRFEAILEVSKAKEFIHVHRNILVHFLVLILDWTASFNCLGWKRPALAVYTGERVGPVIMDFGQILCQWTAP